jgi:hypothetical protein
MPYIKNDDLKQIMNFFFRSGCNTGYGVDHEEDIPKQEDESFEKIYEDFLKNTKRFG